MAALCVSEISQLSHWNSHNMGLFDSNRNQEAVATGRYVSMRTVGIRGDKAIQEALNKGASNGWTMCSFTYIEKTSSFLIVWDRQ